MRINEILNEGVPQLVKQDVAEGSKNLSYIGNCTDDDVIEHIFGDATNFAQAVEKHGNEFTIDDLVVKYNRKSGIHSFYYKKQGMAEGDVVNFNRNPITIKNAKYLGDSRWRLWFNDKKGYYVLHITLYQKDDAGTGWRPADWNINSQPGANVLVKNRTPKWDALCKHIDDYMVEHHYEEMQQAAKEQLDRPSDPSEWGDPVYITTDEPEPDDPDPPKPKKPSLRIVK